MRRRIYVYMYESDYLCADDEMSEYTEIYPHMKLYP